MLVKPLAWHRVENTTTNKQKPKPKNISKGKKGLKYGSEETKFTYVDYFVRILFQISNCFHFPQKNHVICRFEN